MKIDNNETEKHALELFNQGKNADAHKVQDGFIAEVREFIAGKGDHCSCTAKCKYHGKCVECVALHRGHRDHLPECFRSMVNERISALSKLTEDTAYTTNDMQK